MVKKHKGHRDRIGKDNLPDLENLFDLFVLIRGGGNDEQSIKQINGDAMGALVMSATNFGDATVGSHDQDGSHV